MAITGGSAVARARRWCVLYAQKYKTSVRLYNFAYEFGPLTPRTASVSNLLDGRHLAARSQRFDVAFPEFHPQAAPRRLVAIPIPSTRCALPVCERGADLRPVLARRTPGQQLAPTAALVARMLAVDTALLGLKEDTRTGQRLRVLALRHSLPRGFVDTRERGHKELLRVHEVTSELEI